MAVCSEIHTKHINKRFGQNVEWLNVKLAVHIVTTVQCGTIDKGLKFETKHSAALHFCTSSAPRFLIVCENRLFNDPHCSTLRPKLVDKGPNKLSVNTTTAQFADCSSL